MIHPTLLSLLPNKKAFRTSPNIAIRALPISRCGSMPRRLHAVQYDRLRGMARMPKMNLFAS